MPWKEIKKMNQRYEFALRALQVGTNMKELCQAYGISRPTGYKWLKRFREEGFGGMSDRLRRPRRQGRALPEEVVCEIIRLKEHHRHWGPPKIWNLYERLHGNGPSLSSVKRVLDRAGLVHKRRRRDSRKGGRLHSSVKAEAPNDVWTVDFKGWWRSGNGSRCEPLTVRDEYSRYVLEIRAMASTATEAVRLCFERLFAEHGLPAAIRSDNGAPFACAHSVLGLSRLSAWWIALGINLERGRPGQPQDNGAHERLHRDIRCELQACAQDNLAEEQVAFDLWRGTFNQERPHQALGMCTPAEVYVPSPRPWDPHLSDLVYEGMLARRVHKNGSITIDGIALFLSTALSGWSVGLKPREDRLYDVYFASLPLGQIDLSSEAFLWAASGPKDALARQTG